MRFEAWKGHVDLLVLAVLEGEPAHGYRIVDALRERSNGIFDLAEGTVYPALYRLERSGLVRSRWHEVEGRRRRIYRLTRRGATALRDRRASWQVFAEAVRSVLA